MYCSNCGSLIKTELNYCSRCGARVEKLTTGADDSGAAAYLSIATGFVGLGGLGLTVGLIAILLKNGVVIEAIVILTLAFLCAVFGITFSMMQRISQLSGTKTAQKAASENAPPAAAQLNQPHTTQLAEPRPPAMSVTENTTRTLEKESVR